MNLYQLTTEYKQLESILIENEGELTPDLEQALQINQDQLQAKGISYGYVIKSIEAESDIIDTEIKRLTQLKKTRDNAAERLKTTLKQAMEMYGVLELKTPTLKISFRKSESVEIIDMDLLDEKYITKKTTEMANKTEIKEALKRGEVIEGAELRINNNLQIK
jgi:hypothetical protein